MSMLFATNYVSSASGCIPWHSSLMWSFLCFGLQSLLSLAGGGGGGWFKAVCWLPLHSTNGSSKHHCFMQGMLQVMPDSGRCPWFRATEAV